MIQVTPHMRILVAVEPIDFRAGLGMAEGLFRQVSEGVLPADLHELTM